MSVNFLDEPQVCALPALDWKLRRFSLASVNLSWTIPVVVLIAIAAALAVTSLHDYADARRRAQLVLAEIDQRAGNIRQAEQEHEEGHQTAAVTQLAGALLHPLAALPAGTLGGEAADNVREAATQYLENARVHFQLLASGAADAEDWDQSRAQPSYDLLVEAVDDARTFYSAQTALALKRAKIGSTAAIGTETLLLALLIFGTQRMKRSSEQRLAEERIRKEVFFRSLVQNSSDVIAILDASAAVRYLSPSFTRVVGFEAEEQLNHDCFRGIHPEDQEKARLTFSRALDSTDTVMFDELRVRNADQSWHWIEMSATNLLADSNVGGIVVNFRDISDRRFLEDQLRHQALSDPLTGLANRTLFSSLLERALTASRRRKSPVAVFFLDLDDFKQINDGLGHDAGDELLREIAARLRSSLRAEDTPARLGGDEFAVLIEGLEGEALGALAERVLAAMRLPFRLGEQDVTVTTSIGLAVTGSREYTAADLLRDADVALYAAKGAGKGRFEVFEDGMYCRMRKNLELEADLVRALENEELELHYQPIVSLADGRLIGVEALVRWRDVAQRRLVMPGEFLPLAEQTGLILPLGRWVLQKACDQVEAWRQQFPELASITLSVNLSARQFRGNTLLQDIAKALETSGLPSSQLVLDIPEKVLLLDAAVTEERLAGLRDLGVGVAIDDFGGGYFALSYLRRFPIDAVKIHNCFVESLNQGSADCELTRGLIDLARRLKLKTVAEGVEAMRQARTLDGMGCDMGQGYVLGRPLAVSGIEKLLASAEGLTCWIPQAAGLAGAESEGRR